MTNKLNKFLANVPEPNEFEISTVSLVNEFFSDETILNDKVNISLLSASKFKNICFINNDFYGSYFFNCEFHNCTFTKTRFSKAEWYDCTFINCQFDECFFTRTEVNTTIFQSCNFTNVDLIASTLYESTFKDCFFKELPVMSNHTLTMVIMDSKFYKEKEQKAISLNDESDFLKILHEMNALKLNTTD